MKKYDYNNTKLSIEQLKEIIEVYLKGRYTYSDIAEINAKFVSSNEMSTKNVTCTIHLPSSLKTDFLANTIKS